VGLAITAFGKKKQLSGNHKLQLELGAQVIAAEFGDDPTKTRVFERTPHISHKRGPPVDYLESGCSAVWVVFLIHFYEYRL